MNTATLAVLVTSDSNLQSNLDVTLWLDGKPVTPRVEKQKSWQWITIPVSNGIHTISLDTGSDDRNWQGQVQFWLLGTYTPKARTVTFRLTQPLGNIRPLPPYVQPQGAIKTSRKLAEVMVQ